MFLVGEGTSDIGDLAKHSNYREGEEGFLQPLLRRLAGDGVTLEFDGAQFKTLARTQISERDALKRKAAQALTLASTQDCTHLVFVTDVDKTKGPRLNRVRRRKRIAELRATIEAGFAVARPDLADDVRALVATPCRIIEAWAVADSERAPEDLWGDEGDPQSNHPKRVLERLLGDTPETADFRALGESVDIENLIKRCPDSFAPFHEQVQRALEDCPVASEE